MFKGLRAKIEGQNGSTSGTASSKAGARDHKIKTQSDQPLTQEIPSKQINNDVLHVIESKETAPVIIDNAPTEDCTIPEREIQVNVQDNCTKSPHSSSPLPSPNHKPNRTPSSEDISTSQDESVKVLKDQILSLSSRLSAVIEEKEVEQLQGERLKRTIDRLNKDLEYEKKANSSLQTKVESLEAQFRQQKAEFNQQRSSSLKISNKSFNPNELANINSNDTHNIEDLRHKMTELQTQLSRKDRQLKISQQNLNDIKKALQRELSDHRQTREELRELQSRMKGYDAITSVSSCNTEGESSANNNGSYHSETGDTTSLERYYHQECLQISP